MECCRGATQVAQKCNPAECPLEAHSGMRSGSQWRRVTLALNRRVSCGRRRHAYNFHGQAGAHLTTAEGHVSV